MPRPITDKDRENNKWFNDKRPPDRGSTHTARYRAFNQRWGWIKRVFIEQQEKEGSSPFNANRLWQRRRNWLRSQGIQWPSLEDARPFLPGERDQFEEDEDNIQSPPDIEQRPVEDYSRHKGETDKEYVDRVSRISERQREFQDISAYIDQLFEEWPDEHQPENIQREQEEEHHQADQADEFPAGERQPGEVKHKGQGKKSKTQTSEVIEPDIPMSKDAAGPSSAKKHKLGDSESDMDSEGPPDLTKEKGTDGSSPGRNETMGLGGAGGGIAGAGNNTLFKGFAGSTSDKCPGDFSYTQTYKRPFAIYTEFIPREDEEVGATILGPTANAEDGTQASQAGFPWQYSYANCDHGGVQVPYQFMEASMKTRDWNKRNDHVAYKVEEFGFNIPNLRLSVMNNNRADVTEVAPAPPADARMWVFVDVNNDYGIPQSYTNADTSHSELFTEEDILNPDNNYSLPMLGNRSFVLDPTVALTIKSDRAWTTGIGEWTSNDPNALYDMKRHPAYHEFIMSEAQLGMSYKVNAPIVRLPHMPQTSLDFGTRQSYVNDGNLWDMTNENLLVDPVRNRTIHQWHTVTAPYLQNTANDPSTATTLDGLVNYYCAGLSAYTHNIGDSLPITPAQQAVHDQVGSEPVRPFGNPAVAVNAVSAVLRTTGRYNVADDGTNHSTHISKRPPIFTFGVHKELEDQPTALKFWRYFCYGQVEYYARIRWYVKPCLFKPYIPIGPGGLYTSWKVHPQASETSYGRVGQLLARQMYRAGHKFMLTTTDKEAPETLQTCFY